MDGISFKLGSCVIENVTYRSVCDSGSCCGDGLGHSKIAWRVPRAVNAISAPLLARRMALQGILRLFGCGGRTSNAHFALYELMYVSGGPSLTCNQSAV
eukprot:4790383-Pleurochrysis_carterae.AAC.1